MLEGTLCSRELKQFTLSKLHLSSPSWPGPGVQVPRVTQLSEPRHLIPYGMTNHGAKHHQVLLYLDRYVFSLRLKGSHTVA